MTFDTFTWDQPGCALIFGFTREQVWGAADAYLAKNPQTRGNTYDCILGYKKGFLQKSQTIVDLLTTQVAKKDRPAFRAQLERHCKTVGLGEYIYRAPNSMGGEANRAWTCLSVALQDTDENTLKYVILLQRADTNHYCSRARQEYLRENP